MARPFPTEENLDRRQAVIAASRFGYGARPGDLPFIERDPLTWAVRQIAPPAEFPNEFRGLPSSAETTAAMMRFRGGSAIDAAFRRDAQVQYNLEANRHAVLAVNGDTPFRERLVRFWCNHFSLSVTHPNVLPLAYSFEREVVRPNLHRRFQDMLLAAARHPAMHFYLDQAGSIGPNSPVGRARGGQSQELMARALVGLYTMGNALGDPQDGQHGYTASDLQGLAQILTGWSIAGPGDDNPGQFLFREEWHEHGRKRFLGKIYPEAGVLSGEAAIDALARRIETGRNLARKMARYFITDNPPDYLLDEMTSAYADTGGSVGAMTEAMLNNFYAWDLPPTKIKTPEDFVLSAARTLGAWPLGGTAITQAIAQLGQPAKAAPGFGGWPDTGTYWVEGDRLFGRFELAAAYGRYGAMRLRAAASALDGIDIALDTLGPFLRLSTYRRLLVAADMGEQLALLFVSPEFQRR